MFAGRETNFLGQPANKYRVLPAEENPSGAKVQKIPKLFPVEMIFIDLNG